MPSPRIESAPPSRETELRAQLVQRISERRLELPMLPQSAAEVLNVCNEPSCDAARLAALIQRDQSLAAHTLHVSNSAAYAPREPIVSLQQAVSRLGFKTMRDIAVAVALRSKVFVLAGHEERLRAMWVHSAMSGAWAKEIGRVRRRNVEGAFLSGLLHDIGAAVVLQATLELGAEAHEAHGAQKAHGAQEAHGARKAHDAHNAHAAPDAGLLDRLIREFHAEVGGIVLTSWNLPDWMCAAVRWHHDPDLAGPHTEYARTALLADLLAHASETPDEATDHVLRTHPVLADLDLYEEETDALFARRERVLQTAEAFR
jgi:HD-like signal output (HDOD) protein